MTEKQLNGKFTIMKILSIVCLVAVIASGFLPWITLDGDYKNGVLGEISGITESITDEQLDEMQAMFDEEGVDFELEGFIDSIENFMDPITDGAVSPMDFIALNSNFEELRGYILEAADLEGGYALELDSEAEEILEILPTVIMVPVYVFGVLALAAAVRLILRLFNRRGLGVFVAILAGFNFLFGAGLSLILNFLLSETGDASATLTPVPVVMFVCSILGCVFWGQARKMLNPVVVKEEVQIPVPQNIPVPEVPVENTEVEE